MKSILWKLACLATLHASCQKKNNSTAEPEEPKPPTEVAVDAELAESSGIADSKKNAGSLWVIEDSGNPAQLILLGHDGKIKGKIPVKGATNEDWEDVVLSDGFLYIGDIGDNAQQRQGCQIYKVAEPSQGAAETAQSEVIRFKYEDGAHDAEALLVAPGSGEIYLITKREDRSGVYKIAQPYSTSQVNVAKKVATLPFTGVVSAALAPDGKAVLVKTYARIYSFAKGAQAPLEKAFESTPTQMPYRQEPQGEAVCFKQDGSGYFTLSERLLNFSVKLFFYPK